MNTSLKNILISGNSELLDGVQDVVVSKELSADCSLKQSNYVNIVFHAITFELEITLDNLNSPTMDETKDILVLVDYEKVAEEKDHSNDYSVSIPIKSFPQSIDKHIIIAVNGSDRAKGCIFNYHLVFNPQTDLELVSDENRVYSVNLIQNTKSEVQIAMDTSNILFMLNGVPYPAGTALSNARAKQLVSYPIGIVTADINGFILTSEPFSIDQSPCSVTIEQGESIREGTPYIDFDIDVQTSLPHSTNYYIGDNIYNMNYIEYNNGLVDAVVTVVLRPLGQPVLTNLNTVLSNIDNYYAYASFTIEQRVYPNG